MSETYIVVKREFLERVKTKSFLISTLLFPLFMAALIVIPILAGGGGGERRLVLVDESAAGVGERIAVTLAQPTDDAEEARYVIERVPGPFAPLRAQLNARVTAKEIDGYLWVPADVVQTSEIGYRARDIADMEVLRDLRRAASEAVQAERLRSAGLDGGQVASLIRPVDVEAARVTKDGEEGGDEVTTFLFSYIVAFFIYMLIILYGQNVMRSVLDEKTNRIAEVIVSSMKASHLMLGKILGVGAVALFQVAIWAALIALMATQSQVLAERFDLPAGALDALRVEPGLGFALMGFFLFGFLLYAALFAMLGAAVSSEQEAQQLTISVLLPLIVPMMFITRLISDPMDPLSRALGLIPFTAPVAMPMRMGATSLGAGEILTSLGLLLATVLLAVWVAGKIYRVGILSTGKRPTLRELGRWLRAA